MSDNSSETYNDSGASGLNGTPSDHSHCKYYLPGPPIDQCYVSDEELLRSIAEFLEPSLTEWIFLALYLVCFVAGLGGNGLVVWAVCRNSHLRSTTNVLLTNLALADLLAVLVCMPPNFAQTIWESWFLGRTLCKLVEYYQVVFIIVSILTLTAISVERWFAICRPMTFKQTRTRVILCLLLIWAAAHVTAVPKLFIADTVGDPMVPPNLTILLTTCAPPAGVRDMALNYEIFLCVVFYAMPIIVMGYAYTAIAIKLWSSKAGILMEGDSKAMMTQLKVRRRTAKMLIVVVIAFVVCFLPVYIWNMIRLSAPEALSYVDSQIISGITLGAQLLLVINSCINPVIYNFMSVKFRNEFRAVCHCWLKICRSGDKGDSSNNHEMEPVSVKRYLITVAAGNVPAALFLRGTARPYLLFRLPAAFSFY